LLFFINGHFFLLSRIHNKSYHRKIGNDKTGRDT
jgi:hypothetical protein